MDDESLGMNPLVAATLARLEVRITRIEQVLTRVRVGSDLICRACDERVGSSAGCPLCEIWNERAVKAL